MENKRMEITTIFIIIIIGVIAGAFSGFIGIGGGLIVVPALVYFLGFGQHEAQGTSLAMMLPPIGLLAVYNYYKVGHVDFKVSLILAITFILGSFFGSKLAISLNAETLKKAFGIIIIILGIKMILGK